MIVALCTAVTVISSHGRTSMESRRRSKNQKVVSNCTDQRPCCAARANLGCSKHSRGAFEGTSADPPLAGVQGTERIGQIIYSGACGRGGFDTDQSFQVGQEAVLVPHGTSFQFCRRLLGECARRVGRGGHGDVLARERIAEEPSVVQLADLRVSKCQVLAKYQTVLAVEAGTSQHRAGVRRMPSIQKGRVDAGTARATAGIGPANEGIERENVENSIPFVCRSALADRGPL